MQGIRDTLAGVKSDAAPGDRLTGQNGWTEIDGCPLYTDDDFPRSVQQMEDILGKYPNLDAFIPTGGFPQFIPQAYAPRSEKHKDEIASGELALVVADTLPVQIDLMKEGLSLGQVGQRPFEMGYETMGPLNDIEGGRRPRPTRPTPASMSARPRPPIPASAADRARSANVDDASGPCPGASCFRRESMTQHTLRAGDLELVVDAARGGSIMAFRRGAFDLMRAWDGSSADPRSFASFPLVPFSGRIDHGHSGSPAAATRCLPTFSPEPHAIHGDGWTSPWTLVSSTCHFGRAGAGARSAGDVLRYRATQMFRLYPDRLEIAMSLTNRGPEPMPFGLGHHPYFGDRDQAVLSAEVDGVWLPDDLNVPKQLEKVPVLWGFRHRRPVDELALDHVFQGWNRVALVEWPEAGEALEISADELFGHLVVYTPPGQPFFCVEPVT